MKAGVIIGLSIVAALIAGGEIEQGYFDIGGIVSAAWLAFVAIANIRRKRKAPRGNSEPGANYTHVIKHSLMLSQTDLHVNREVS